MAVHRLITVPVRRTGTWGAGSRRRAPRWLALLLLTPALALLGVFIVYPITYSVARSLRDDTGKSFVWFDNYQRVFTDPHILTAIRNTAIWVVVAPTTACALGLVLAVLADRVRWATAFRVVLFMPMAISLFASGVIFRLMYEEDPARGVANAVAVGVHDLVASPSPYPGSRPRDGGALTVVGGDVLTTATHRNGDVVPMALVGTTSRPPQQALAASTPAPSGRELRGVVWLDASPTGLAHARDGDELGMPRIVVQALRDGQLAGTATTGDDGSFALTDLPDGRYQLRLPESNFTTPFRGHTWLAANLITPVIISCWVWIMTGFALTFLAVGLAAIPREVIEASRVDGATEGQILRRVTVPLLSPVLLVVFVTLVVTVLKVFDLVYVIAPASAQDEASVLAIEIWRVSFGTGTRYGLGSALCVVLFLLVTPAMVLNIRRFRKDRR